jgi:signal transduction histidine kinase
LRVRSLRSRLFVVWVLSLAASAAVAVMLVQIWQGSASAQAARAEFALARACDLITDRWNFYTTDWADDLPVPTEPRVRRDLSSLLTVALASLPRVEAGIWREGEGSLVETAPPPAQVPRMVAATAEDGAPRDLHAGGDGTSVVLRTCPLPGPVPALVAWVALRSSEIPGTGPLRLGLGVLLALALGISAGLSWLLLAWRRALGGIEASLAGHEAGGLPRLAPTGERELDRMVAALNAASARADGLAARVAVSERLAALGRVAAGVAHEIRNPVAAMRLRAENALAGDDARRKAALGAVLEQIGRIDRLVGELLAMTQRRDMAPETVDVEPFLEAAAADHRSGARRLEASSEVATARFDPALVRRALDALLDNAARHTPPDGRIRVHAARQGAGLRFTVTDTGPGIDASVRQNLFEPFVTGRANGTGLGLAIAREMAAAHGGTITLLEPGGAAGVGASFAIDIPEAGHG